MLLSYGKLKNSMRRFVEPILAFFARRIVAKYEPKIVGITGSVGKTSTRAAVFAVLSQRYSAYTPPKNLNDKIGLPLGIIGMDSPGKSMIGWAKVLARALSLLLFRQKYPEVLVLEYGIDRVGEMGQLLAIAVPQVSVLTSIGFSHYEFFSDIETVAREKSRILEALPASGIAVLNGDDERVLAQSGKAKGLVITYGHTSQTVDLLEQTEIFTDTPATTLRMRTPRFSLTARLSALGAPHVSAGLAAVAVAEALGVEESAVVRGLAAYRPVPGRLHILGGVRRSWVIDDTYNASPDSMREALALLGRFPGAHKLAVLGDMLELGAVSDAEHQAIGRQAASLGVNHLVTVGPSGKIIAEAALAAGLPEERVISFDTSAQATVTVQELMREGSVVLVKGSQGVRMERITKEIMAEPMRAGDLLCRQYGTWLRQ